jgi:hypothetical protein
MYFQNTWFIKIYNKFKCCNFCVFFHIHITFSPLHKWTSCTRFFSSYLHTITIYFFVNSSLDKVYLWEYYVCKVNVFIYRKWLCFFSGEITLFTKKWVQWKRRTICPYIHNFCLNSLRIIIRSPLSKITEGSGTS